MILLFYVRTNRGENVMYRKTLLFDVQQDGASPLEEGLSSVDRPGGSSCRALVKFEPAPEWLVLYFKSEVKK
jgi:hypothetical protein